MITWIIPYYRAQAMLRRQLEHLADYPNKAVDRLQWIYVDDGSPELERPDDILRAAPERIRSRVRVLRILDDIPWNQHGARNLGAQEAKTDWLLMTDMDRALTAYDMRRLLDSKRKRGHHYKPLGIRLCKDFPRSDDKLPVNQLLVHRDDYWRVGGHDEDYCGSYGGDRQFLDALEKIAPLHVMRDVRILRYQDEALAGSETFMLDRRGEYRDLFVERVNAKRAAGNEHDAKGKNIRFAWKEIEL